MGLFNKKEVGYTSESGSVRFLDGSTLNRPTSLPKKFAAVGAVFVIVAAVLGGTVVYKTYDAAVNGPRKEQAQLQTNLGLKMSYDIPILSELMAMDDETLRQTLSNSGNTMYDLSLPEDNPNGGFDSVKLPEGMTTEEAAAMYAKGVSNLNASSAAKLLNGSWTINVNRKDYVDMRIRYCDFTSGSIDDAIVKAMKDQGLDESILGEYGTDNAGNTFQSGVVQVDDVMYSWRVSACPLTAVYDFYGFPEDGVYVGIRITE